MSRFNYSTPFDRESDASEADPNDIAKILKDTDDLDVDLFTNFSTKSTNLSKTMPSSNKSASVMQRNKSFTFDDDPLADIDSLIGKSNANKTKQTNEKKPPFSPTNSSNNNPLASTMPASSSFNYSPSITTTTTSNRNNTPKNNNLFDDIEDSGLLDNMGIEKNKKIKSSNENIPTTTTTKSKSLVDELFGKASSNTSSFKEEKSDQFEFKLSDRYLNMSQQQQPPQQSVAKTNDDDFSFGGYVPSAVGNAPRSTSVPRQPRNVGFTDVDLFGGSGEHLNQTTTTSPARPKTTSTINNNNNRSEERLSKTMPSGSNDDWLSIIEPSNNRTNNRKKSLNDSSLDDLLRPRSDSITKTSNNAPIKQANNDLDWLGFKEKDSDVLSNSINNLKNVANSPSKTKPPPAPTNHSSAINSPIPHLENEKQQQQQLTLRNKQDSMNSSFADSIENNMDNNRLSTINTTNNILNILNNIQPLKTNNDTLITKQKQEQENSAAPSEAEDGWLNTLITNKKIVEPKKNNEIQNQKIFNPINTTNIQNLTKTNKSSFHPINDHQQLSNLNYDSNEAQSMIQKIKQLEYENQDLHMQLQHIKSHYELQIQLIQESSENRIQMMREDRDNSLRIYRDEKESMQAHMDLIEKEKQQLSAVHKKKTDDLQKEYDLEIDKMRQLQRESIDKLKQEHDEALRRVKLMKETELDAAIAATSHTRTIESVLNLIEDNTKNLDGLSEKIKMNHLINLNEHEIQIKTKQDYLKIQEERLNKKQKEYEAEIRSLNETIQRLENHLAEQSKQAAEERWKGKQQEKKLEALQDALLNEQKIVMDKLARERNDVDRAKDDILVEQKRLMQQMYEEKRKIAEERAQVDAAFASYKDRQHKDSLSNINIEAEISVSTRRLNDEKSRIEQFMKEYKEKEAQLQQEKQIFEEKKQQLEAKSAKLEQMAAIVNKKYSDSDDLVIKSVKEKESNIKILEHINSIKSSQESRLNQIQQQLANVNEREAQLNQEKIAVYKQRQELELYKNNITCSKCKEPVKDFGLLGLSIPTSGYGSYIQANLSSTQTSQTFHSPLFNAQIQTSNLEESKLLRQLKMQTLKDRQFIIEEKQFIDTLGSKSSLNF